MESRGKRGHGEPELKQGVSMSGEERFGGLDVTIGEAGSLGIVVVWRGWATWAWKRGERRRFQIEVASSGGEDALVVDCGDVGTGTGNGWRLCQECGRTDED